MQEQWLISLGATAQWGTALSDWWCKTEHRQEPLKQNLQRHIPTPRHEFGCNMLYNHNACVILPAVAANAGERQVVQMRVCSSSLTATPYLERIASTAKCIEHLSCWRAAGVSCTAGAACCNVE